MEIGYIYKLTCSENGDCYYGSTKHPKIRLYQHKSSYNNCSSKYLIDPTMEILETLENTTKEELENIEKEYILNNTCINNNVPRRTPKELYEKNKIENPNYLKELYEKSEGKMRNLRTRMICDCGGIYVKRNKPRHLITDKHINYIDNL